VSVGVCVWVCVQTPHSGMLDNMAESDNVKSMSANLPPSDRQQHSLDTHETLDLFGW
jgi:hypothetical protein